ncbi:putative bifunctional diguanylate cyclase/phosphodiesterase [Roseicitreum antarcticum]|uniref:EAL domain, c-di-GMP-specific phosphodiesterase class I (Or its enzymatically inactive variant) n=1 Tax=Roseicitreum antarcticum TaxID=564137 RepID=A0A1H3F9G2_9RHOB|nr:sensor domain-containing phosphodiesterase [Roseicitreum antarcticum]SDX86834.1 EAL domain, c-di-GMP-specific phosphodiesterase class I (or its enzymatically inactive variant) [Roseicitreum antarcticum]
MVKIDEALRLDALHQLKLLDTISSDSFDRITRMASQIFNLPVAAISLTDSDRQWFKSRVGIDHSSIPREKAPCGEVADSRQFLVIRDFSTDTYYADSPLGQNGTRFYAGAPLITRDGFGLGSLCVLGREPRDITKAEVAALKDLAAMVMAQIELHHAFGRVDPVSGLPNRNQFLEDMADLANAPESAERVAFLLDLLSLEQISDYVRVMGPGRVDELVRKAVLEIRRSVAPGEAVYHVGTAQFVLLAQPGATPESFVKVVHEYRRSSPAGDGSPADGAIGIVSFKPHERTPRDLLRALHSAAQDARNSPDLISVYSHAADRIYQRRYHLLEDFATALESPDQLRLVYQPRIDLMSGKCLGAEALLRWEHPVLGNIPPDDFIPMTERSSRASALTAYVLGAAIRQMRDWQEAGLLLTISVNISASNLAETDFVDTLAAAVRHHEIPFERLELEVTESAIMHNPAYALAQLQKLSDLGVRVAIDDFGTGHSSLAYLRKLPADVVKIDKSFVTHIGKSAQDQALVRSMVKLSQELGYRVVAEGVESAQIAMLLREMGCEEAQGYYFARPLEAVQFLGWLHAPETGGGGQRRLRSPRCLSWCTWRRATLATCRS